MILGIYSCLFAGNIRRLLINIFALNDFVIAIDIFCIFTKDFRGKFIENLQHNF